jgi:hypothetical protein
LARITAASEVVRRLGAVQAQDYYGAKWAIGLRSSATDAAIEQAFSAGAILSEHRCRRGSLTALPPGCILQAKSCFRLGD